MLYDTAALQSGFDLDDTVAFTHRIHQFLKLSLGLELTAEVDVSKLPEEKAPIPEPEPVLEQEQEPIDLKDEL